VIDLSWLTWADLAPFIVIGFLAQLLDGLLGMGFGVLSNSLLVMLGLPPANANAAVRTAESFTSGISGLSHAAQRNIDWPLFGRLVLPGIIGGVIGVWILTNVDFDDARPIVLVYLSALGVYLVWRGSRRPQTYRRMRFVGPLGLSGGFLDAVGGGGWGPVVTGSLLAQGATPRTAVGTANAAEFFVTVTVLATFIGALGIQSVTAAAVGLVIGGVVAAPLGAFLVNRIKPSLVVTLAGGLMIVIGLYGLLAIIIEPLPTFPRF
jgi:uncharacterized protein